MVEDSETTESRGLDRNWVLGEGKSRVFRPLHRDENIVLLAKERSRHSGDGFEKAVHLGRKVGCSRQ